jgi:orotidine-5'-phosphate decarboxylase
MTENSIIVALDALTEEQALELARALSGAVWGFKVNDLLLHCGVRIVSKLKEFGNVFADPKLHDIPNTVANSIRHLDDAGADLITVHASGGRMMVEAAVKSVRNARVLAVTLLTSLSSEDSRQIYCKSPSDTVLLFASVARQAGAHGIVCSPEELTLLTEIPEYSGLVKVTPGIRPEWHRKNDDQKRIMTPREAVRLGSSYIVVGRPIIEHPNPVQAVRMIEDELS